MVEENKRIRMEEALKSVEHPEIAYSLFELGMIKDINIEESKVSLVLKVPTLSVPIKDYLITSIEEALKKEDEDVRVEVKVEEMDKEERVRFMKMAQEGWRG